MSCSTAFDDQVVSAFAGDHLCGTFSCIRTGAQHTHRVVVGEQHIFDGLVADCADLGDQVFAPCQRRGSGVAHQNIFVTNDDARIGVTFCGIGPAVRAELGQS